MDFLKCKISAVLNSNMYSRNKIRKTLNEHCQNLIISHFYGVYITCFLLQKILELANIREKPISIWAGNLNLGPSYLITTVLKIMN